MTKKELAKITKPDRILERIIILEEKVYDLENKIIRLETLFESGASEDVSSEQKESMLEEKVYKTFIQIGVCPNLLGFDYLKRAVMLKITNPMYGKCNMTKVLYPKIAEEFNSTPARVERACRHAIINNMALV